MTTSASGGVRPRPGRKTIGKPAPNQVSDETVAELSKLFKMLADASRLKILLALAHNGPMNVSALRDLLAQSQPAVSHHLALMRISHLVRCERKGKQCFYRLDSSGARDLVEQLFTEAANGTKQIQLEDLALCLKRR